MARLVGTADDVRYGYAFFHALAGEVVAEQGLQEHYALASQDKLPLDRYFRSPRQHLHWMRRPPRIIVPDSGCVGDAVYGYYRALVRFSPQFWHWVLEQRPPVDVGFAEHDATMDYFGREAMAVLERTRSFEKQFLAAARTGAP